jgi:sterol desaturase/sphingolipid hydroxylase (fatty acid hydroxylase superfamily)
MTDINTKKNGLIDNMPRDKRGFWQPERGTAPPNPFFAWPPKPVEVFKWLFGFPGYLFPWNIIYMAIATLTWLYLQPALSRCVEFRADWIIEIYVRNQAMLVIIVSGWHLRLWSFKSQGLKYKYTSDWMATGKRKFLWGNQFRDNVFWSCVSGGTIWTAYEVLMVWAYANEIIPYVDPREQPVYFIILLCSIQMLRLFHFYWIHRLLHWLPLYKAGHYLHHKNINIGPWSGLSMHPIEHILYFSSILIHWVVPSHPIHMLMNAQHAAFTPAQGHVGFEKLVLKGNASVPAASYFHQLHHRYFECNYGEPDIPLDMWFGTNYDGSAEAHSVMEEKRKARHNITSEVD